MIDKVVASFDEAVRDIPSGATLLIGGFGGPMDAPGYLIAAMRRLGAGGLTIVGNIAGWGSQVEKIRERMAPLIHFPDDYNDIALLAENGQIKKGIFAFPAAMGHGFTPFERKVMAGEAELELVGQGTIAERVRAGRAGIPAFYTPVGVGTFVGEGKEVREFEGRNYLLERAIKGDYSLIRAHQADRYGNLVYRRAARTFNATMAGASTVTIAEVDEVVELGALDPETIVTSGVYVQRVVVRPKTARPWNQPA